MPSFVIRCFCNFNWAFKFLLTAKNFCLWAPWFQTYFNCTKTLASEFIFWTTIFPHCAEPQLNLWLWTESCHSLWFLLGCIFVFINPCAQSALLYWQCVTRTLWKFGRFYYFFIWFILLMLYFSTAPVLTFTWYRWLFGMLFTVVVEYFGGWSFNCSRLFWAEKPSLKPFHTIRS